MDDCACFDWRPYDGYGRICSSEAGGVSAPRVGYKVTHKFPNQALQEPLQILDHYLRDTFGVQ